METVFLKLLNMSISAGWLVLAIVILRRVFKKMPKAVRCVLWALAAIRLVIPITWESAFSLIPESLAPNVGDSVNPIQVITFAASIIWIVGVFAMLIYALYSYVRINNRVSASILLRDNIYICDYIEMPFIFGIIRPRIYLSSTLEQDVVDYVIAHEEAHIRRHDHWWKPLGFLLLSLYWFHPILWIAYILFSKDIELACDERVIKELGEMEKKPYSEALLQCSVLRKTITACPLAFGEVGVRERVRNVLDYKKPSLWIFLATGVSCIVVAGVSIHRRGVERIICICFRECIHQQNQ